MTESRKTSKIILHQVSQIFSEDFFKSKDASTFSANTVHKHLWPRIHPKTVSNICLTRNYQSTKVSEMECQ